MSLQVQAASPWTLEKCYELALKHHLSISVTEEQINEVRAQFGEIRGKVLPKLNVNVQESLQDSTQSAGVNSSFTRQSRPEVSLELVQPLFQGFAEFQALKALSLSQDVATLEWEKAKRDLYTDVASVFVTVSHLEVQRGALSQMIQVITQVTHTLSQDVAVGKGRESELASQKAQLALVRADYQRLEGDIKKGYQALSFLTGVMPHPRIVPYKGSKYLKPLETYFTGSSQTFEIKQAKLQEQIKARELKAQKGRLWPHVDATAHYYPYRVGYQKDIKWDALLKMEVPVLNFEQWAIVSEAKSQKKQAAFMARHVERDQAEKIRQLHLEATSQKAQLVEYQKALGWAKQGFALTQEDYQKKLVDYAQLLKAQEVVLESLQKTTEYELALAKTVVELNAHSPLQSRSLGAESKRANQNRSSTDGIEESRELAPELFNRLSGGRP